LITGDAESGLKTVPAVEASAAQACCSRIAKGDCFSSLPFSLRPIESVISSVAT
jgi:hypothetical protein